MERWVCELCGYIYDPQKGSEEVPPGISFEDLPDDWVCPECLAEKERFQLEYLSTQQRMPRNS